MADDNTGVMTEYRWTLEPRDLFDSPTEFEEEGVVFGVSDGAVVARLHGDLLHDGPFKTRLTDTVQRHVKGQAFARRATCCVGSPTVSVIDPAGNRSIHLTIECAVAVLDGMGVDAVMTDSTGHVVRDTRAERVAEQGRVREVMARRLFSDALLEQLVSSHRMAASDPRNFLVHLYEIRDALQTRYGSARVAQQELGVSPADWKRLGEITNDLPLAEGRHRGRTGQALRPATIQERNEAWTLAERLVLAYVDRGAGS